MTKKRQRPPGLGLGYSRTPKELIYAGHRVPTEEVLNHIELLHNKYGHTLSGIGRAAGLTPSTVVRMYRDKNRTCTQTTARLILSVKPQPDKQQSLVPSVGAHRRIKALQYMGWTIQQIGEMLGVSSRRVCNILNINRILWETHEDLKTIYDSHCMTFGGHTRTSTLSKTKGYHPPMAWLDIDDPDEIPIEIDNTEHKKDRRDTTIDWVAVELACRYEMKARDITFVERREVVRILTERGMSAESIAHKLHTTDRTIQRDREVNSRGAR